MVYGIVQWVLISLILIILVDHQFRFFKDTLTIPKVKDLVNQPSESYREIEKTLNSTSVKRKYMGCYDVLLKNTVMPMNHQMIL